MKHFLSISDLSVDMLGQMIATGLEITQSRKIDGSMLQGKVIGIYFASFSTRTRTAFSVGALRQGASIVTYGPNDLQIATGETHGDTAHVLSQYLDALVVRTNGPIQDLRVMAQQQKMAIVNAMSENEHPTQVIGDMITLHEAFGRLRDLHVLYIGEGNNTAAALALAIGKTPGMRLTLATPAQYALSSEIMAEATTQARQNGAFVEQLHNFDALPRGVDAVYTTRWETMGVKRLDPDWRTSFACCRVTPELMDRVGTQGHTIFMHDLPAVRGQDVIDDVLDGPQSWAFRQAYHKMTGAMVILRWSLDTH